MFSSLRLGHSGYKLTLLVCLFQLTTGASAVWTSPAFLKLKSSNSTENPLQKPITTFQEALLASIHAIGSSVGPLLFSKTADLLGRKWFLIVTALIDFCSSIILALSTQIYMYYFARLLQGFCMGCRITVVPLYISEISENYIRGKLVVLNNVFICLGNVYGYTMGSFFSLRTFTLICSAPLTISVPLVLISVPESPIQLVKEGKEDQATRAIEKFRNLDNIEAEKILRETKEMIDGMPVAQNMIALLRNRSFRRSLTMSIGIFIFVQLTGICALLEYLHTIFFLANIPFSRNMSSILVSIIQTFAVFLGAIMIEKLGRKRLQLSSAFVVATSLFVMGLYFQFEESNFNTQIVSWLPVVAIIIFVAAYGCGMGPVCFVLMSEIFPTEHKMTAAAFSVFISNLCSFVMIFCFPVVRDFFGIQWCFWILGTCTFFSMVFTHFFVVETKNKSFLEIQTLLEKKINYRKPDYS